MSRRGWMRAGAALAVLLPVIAAVTGAASGASNTSNQGPSSEVLFSVDAAPSNFGVQSLTAGDDVVRSRFVEVDTDTVSALLVEGDLDAGTDQGDGRWTLPARQATVELFDGAVLSLDPIEAVATYPSVGDEIGNDVSPSTPTIEWQGRIGTDTVTQVTASLVLDPLANGGYAVSGTVDLSDRWVTISHVTGTTHVLQELDPNYDYPHDHVIAAPPEDDAVISPTVEAADAGVLDESGDDEVGILSHSSATRTINVLVARATNVTVSPSTLVAGVNQAFSASASMPMRLNLARGRSITYTQRARMQDDLENLRTGSAGLGVLLTERNTYKADLVVLVVPNTTNACGVGYLPNQHGSHAYGFAVMAQPCGTGTFAHEVGHNLGGHHNPENASGGCKPFAYSCGHRVANVARTVMAYDYSGCNCPRQLRYSTPLANFGGTTVKSGIASKRDNRRSLLRLAPFVEAYRPGHPVGGYGPSSRTLTAVNVSGWALDPNTINASQVQVHINGSLRTTVTANQNSSYVASHYPAYGANHGFSATVSFIGLGDANVCLVAVNYSGTPGSNRSLGCRNHPL